jgi:predicted CXXCH cytochrome family protein
MRCHGHIIFRLFPTIGLLLLGSIPTLAFDPAASTEFTMSQDSAYCKSCHDGVLAREIHRGHSVDIDYLFAQMRSGGKLKPKPLLDPALNLQDGRMVCTTCHHPESPYKGKLVISNVGSNLCLACHNL